MKLILKEWQREILNKMKDGEPIRIKIQGKERLGMSSLQFKMSKEFLDDTH